MVSIKYNIEIKNNVIHNDLKKIINQVYKLLPMREEQEDWQKPLETLMVQLGGMSRLFKNQQDVFFPLICKMEGLFNLTKREDFQLYRRTIFECLSLLNILNQKCQSNQ